MKFKNTYLGGLNRDLSKQKYPNNKIYDAFDFRVMSDVGLSTGALENVKGNIKAYDIIGDALADQNIIIAPTTVFIGNCLVRQENVILGVDNSTLIEPGTGAVITGIDYVIKLYTDVNYVRKAKVIWFSNTSGNTGRLNLSTAYPIYDTVPRYENQNLKKFYFTDNNSCLRYGNIKTLEDDIDANGVSTISAHTFDIVPISNMPTPKFIETLSGGVRKSGMMQYFYQVYKANGAVSTLSLGTGMIHLTTADDNNIVTPWSNAYTGDAQGVNTGKSVKISIDGIDISFNRIRIIACHYQTYTSSPTVEIIYEGAVNTSIEFVDTGTTILGTYTVEELVALQKNGFVCKSISTKNNFLFAGNIQEEILHTQQIIDFDTRVYRFNNSGQADIDDPTSGGGYTIFAGTNGHWHHVTSPTIFGDDWTLPVDADCINFFNDVTNDGVLSNEFMYLEDGVTLGAVGKHFTIRPKIRKVKICESIPNVESWYVRPVDTTYTLNGVVHQNRSYPDYGSPKVHEIYVGYQRGETYRLSTRFIDSKGRKSYPKWMCDFRMPFNSDIDSAITFYTNGGVSQYNFALTDDIYNGVGPINDLSANVLYLQIAINDLTLIPDDPFIVGQKCTLEIMRVKREGTDRTMVCSGVLNNVEYFDAAGVYPDSVAADFQPGWTGLHSLVGQGGSYQQSVVLRSFRWDALTGQRMYALYSPEVSYFNNINIQADDKIHLMQWCRRDYYANPTSNRVIATRSARYGVNSAADTRVDSYNVVDNKYLGWEKDSGTSISVGSISVSNAIRASNAPYGISVYSQSGSAIYMKLDGEIKKPIGIPDWYQHVAIVNVKRALSKQYGGNTFTDRSNNLYITTNACSEKGLLGTIDVFGGDTYISNYAFKSVMSTDDIDSFECVNYVPIESSINTAIQGSISSWPILKSWNTKEKAGIYNPTIGAYSQLQDWFVYNSAYSRENDAITSPALPLDNPQGLRNDVMVKASQKKFNGEIFDNWLDFLVNDFTEVDTQYGPITRLASTNNILFAIQDKAVSQIEVNTRSVITDGTGLPLALGTGLILSRYDYVTNTSGSRHQPSIIIGRRGLYYYDEYNNAICLATQEGGEVKITDVQGLQSFMVYNTPAPIRKYDNPFLAGQGTVLAVKDQLYDEIIFVFRDNDDAINAMLTSFTLSVNEDSSLFHQRYGCYPDLWILGNGEYFSMKQYNTVVGNVYLHVDGLRGVWYEEAATESSVTLLINPGEGAIGIYNNLTWFTEVTNNGVDVYNLTLTSYRAWNDYQDTGLITLTDANLDSDGAMQRIMRQWKTDVERDHSVGAVDDPRMRDGYMFLKLNFQNQQNPFGLVPPPDYRIVLHDIITSITPSSF